MNPRPTQSTQSDAPRMNMQRIVCGFTWTLYCVLAFGLLMLMLSKGVVNLITLGVAAFVVGSAIYAFRVWTLRARRLVTIFLG